jgi:tetratricopeptide (TPR) repeat protein
VVLSACQSDDLAHKLVLKGVPAVVAMQYSILDQSATRFAFSFYQALAAGKSVDRSLTEARLAMRNAEGGNNVDFATPVLYLLDSDCLRIDQIQPAAAELFKKPVMLGEVQVMREGFVGRQKELHLLQRALLSGVKRAVIVHGWGGIGKTVLASRLALRLDRHFEGVYGHKCNPQTRAEDLLNGLNAFLNMAGISALNQVLYSPAPLEVKTSVLTSILNQKRFLIVLDNFESCLDQSHKQIADPELRRLVEALLNATASNTKFIITTRYDFDPLAGRLMNAIEHFPVPEMPLYQAVWLMNNFTNLASLDYEKKKEIYKAIGGHPWTIGMFSHHASTATVDGLLLELGPLYRELRDFTLFDKSYSELNDAARELLIRTSIFEEAVPVEALRWMMGSEEEPSPSVDDPLHMLRAWGLMSRQEEREGTLYSVHTKVRDFVGGLAGVDRRDLQVRAAQFYELRVKTSGNLWDHLRARDYYYKAEEWETAAEIVIAAWKHLARWGYIELAMRLLQQSVETTQGIKKAIALGNLAILYQDVSDWKTALMLHGEVKEIFEQQGDMRNVAVSLHQLGMIQHHQGNYAEAIKLYQQSLELAQTLGDKSGIANTIHQIGMIHQALGNYAEAIKLYQQSLELAQTLGDKSGIANTIHQLGMIHQAQGNYAEAMKLYQESLELARELGDKAGIASSLHQIGIIHQDQGNYTEAMKLYQESLELAKVLGDRSGIASSLHQIGMVHQDQGNYNEALKLYEQALDIKIELGDKSGIARILHQLGIVHIQLEKYDEAIKLYQQSLKLAKELGDKREINIILKKIANIYAMMDKNDDALKLYRQNLIIEKELGEKNEIANTLYLMASISKKTDRCSQAIELFKQSSAIKEELGNYIDALNIEYDLANQYLVCDNYKEINKLFKQIFGSIQLINDKNYVLEFLNKLTYFSELVLKRGDWSTAKEIFLNLKEYYKKLEDKFGFARALLGLAQCEQLSGNFERSRLIYKDALYHFSNLDKQYSAIAAVYLGRLELQTGFIEDSIDHLIKAKKHFEESGNQSNLAAVKKLLELAEQVAITQKQRKTWGKGLIQFNKDQNNENEGG